MSIISNLLGGGDLIREIGQTVRQVLPDSGAQHDFDLKIAELADKADERETTLMQGQIEINKIEASSSNLFVAGWRPFIGWTGGFALAYTWILSPLLKWVADLSGHVVGLPALDPGAIYPIVVALLGVGTMRTVEKVNGVATSLNNKVLTPMRAK